MHHLASYFAIAWHFYIPHLLDASRFKLSSSLQAWKKWDATPATSRRGRCSSWWTPCTPWPTPCTACTASCATATPACARGWPTSTARSCSATSAPSASTVSRVEQLSVYRLSVCCFDANHRGGGRDPRPLIRRYGKIEKKSRVFCDTKMCNI